MRYQSDSLVRLDVCCASGSMGTKELWLKDRLAGATLFKTATQGCFLENVCANPLGHSATPHCFAHLAKLKSVKQVKFFPFPFILWPSSLQGDSR